MEMGDGYARTGKDRENGGQEAERAQLAGSLGGVLCGGAQGQSLRGTARQFRKILMISPPMMPATEAGPCGH